MGIPSAQAIVIRFSHYPFFVFHFSFFVIYAFYLTTKSACGIIPSVKSKRNFNRRSQNLSIAN